MNSRNWYLETDRERKRARESEKERQRQTETERSTQSFYERFSNYKSY